MSLPDLYSFSRNLSSTSSYYTDKAGLNSLLYKGEIADIVLHTYNGDTEAAEAFDVDLYISTDAIIDTSDQYFGTYNFTNGLAGNSNEETRVSLPLPDSNSSFWVEQKVYYIGAIVDPDNDIAESNEDNNNMSTYFDFFNEVEILQTDLPIVNFQQEQNNLEIKLSEAAPTEGLTIKYRALEQEFHIDKLDDVDPINGGEYGTWAYDSESDRIYVRGGSYYDLGEYNYYDTEGGHYDSEAKIYHNADGSYYDIQEKLFYDVERNSSKLTDNSAEYFDLDSSSRHYLPTGGYISLVDDFYYDPLGGRIDEEGEKFLFDETDTSGFDIRNIKQNHSIEVGGIATLPRIATPGLDYELVAGSNISEITDTTITIAPGETTATVNLDFLADSIFDPSEVIQLQLLADDQAQYVVGHSSVSFYDFPKPNLEDLQNPHSGNLNFSVDKNAKSGTVVGQLNFSDPQEDELIYSLVSGQSVFNSSDRYADLNLDPDLIATSNQDLDGDGKHPFSIDSKTGTITLTDFDDLDREAVNHIAPADGSQLYHDGYYQLLVRVSDTIPTTEDLQYSTIDLSETSLINIQVVDILGTSDNNDLVGSTNNDIIDSLAGSDTIKGMAGDDTLRGGADQDFLLGDLGQDLIEGNEADDFLNGGEANDILHGDAGDDFLIGMTGNDILHGDAGNDFLIGMTENDILYGDAGNDFLNGGSGNDLLNGGLNNDVLLGMDSDDILKGNEGNDILYGGAGIDSLNGNGGVDTFALRLNLGQDLIVDFEDGVDLIGISGKISFEQLSILDENSSTIIWDNLSNEVLAVVEGINADLITETDFTIVE